MNTPQSGLVLALALSLLSTPITPATAAEPLLEYHSKSDVKLPPLSERKVLGTWKIAPVGSTAECTRSFEQVAAKVYNVMRCSDGSALDTVTLK